jgi:hypothetical protein
VEIYGIVADVLGHRVAQVVEDVAENDLRPLLDEQPDLGLPCPRAPPEINATLPASRFMVPSY